MIFTGLENLLQHHHIIIIQKNLGKMNWFEINVITVEEELNITLVVNKLGVKDFDHRLVRCIPYQYKSFLEAAVTKGIIKPHDIIKSKLIIPLENCYQYNILSRLLLKNLVIFNGALRNLKYFIMILLISFSFYQAKNYHFIDK